MLSSDRMDTTFGLFHHSSILQPISSRKMRGPKKIYGNDLDVRTTKLGYMIPLFNLKSKRPLNFQKEEN